MVLRTVGVTGASGMLGRHLVSSLVRKGINVKATSINELVCRYENVSWSAWDLRMERDANTLNDMFYGVDALIHAGAVVPDGSTEEDLLNIFDVNVRSTLCLGEWALKNRLPFVFISGSTVYREPERENIKEDDPKVISGLGGFYGYSKLLAEMVLLHLAEKGLPLCVLRPSSIYGYGLHANKTISKYLKTAGQDGVIKLTPPVEDAIDLVHALDIAAAVIKALEHDCRGIYNLGGQKAYSIMEIAKCCIAVAGAGRIKVTENRTEIKPKTRFGLNCECAVSEFGYHPEVNLHDGISMLWHKQCY